MTLAIGGGHLSPHTVATKDLLPAEIVALLLATANDGEDPERNNQVSKLRVHFFRIARHCYPRLGDEIEDAVQLAVVEMCRVENLLAIEDRSRFMSWARRILVHRCEDAKRSRERRSARLIELRADDDDDDGLEDWLGRLGAPWDDDPESTLDRQMILRLVVPVIRTHEVGRLRLLLDLSEEEVCARLRLTRDQVANQLKRLRAKLRKLLKSAGMADT